MTITNSSWDAVSVQPFAISASSRGSTLSQQIRIRPGSVASELFDNPWKFDFFQAVLLLQRFAAEQDDRPACSIGQFARPAQEALRFKVPHTMAFPTSTIAGIDWDFNEQRAHVNVNFMGLTGPSGILPRSYTERLNRIETISRCDERHAMRDWFDNFNHRMISLFFDAWCKYRFPVAIGRQRTMPGERKQEPTLIRVALSAIAGLEALPVNPNPPKEQKTCPAVDRDELLGIAGALAQRPMNAANLQSIAQQCLGVPIKVKQFDGCWLNLDEDSQLQLGTTHCELGQNALLGERVWNRQQKIRLVVGPLSKEDFQRFLPPTADRLSDGYRRLSELVRICIRSTLEFDFQPVLSVDEALETRLSSDGEATQLGIDSWMGTPDCESVNDAIFSGV